MDTIDEIICNSNLILSIQKIRNSIDEIKSKHPTREDLFISMESTVEQLTVSYIGLIDVQKEARMLKSRCLDLEIINVKNQSEILYLQKLVEELKEKL